MGLKNCSIILITIVLFWGGGISPHSLRIAIIKIPWPIPLNTAVNSKFFHTKNYFPKNLLYKNHTAPDIDMTGAR